MRAMFFTSIAGLFFSIVPSTWLRAEDAPANSSGSSLPDLKNYQKDGITQPMLKLVTPTLDLGQPIRIAPVDPRADKEKKDKADPNNRPKNWLFEAVEDQRKLQEDRSTQEKLQAIRSIGKSEQKSTAANEEKNQPANDQNITQPVSPLAPKIDPFVVNTDNKNSVDAATHRLQTWTSADKPATLRFVPVVSPLSSSTTQPLSFEAQKSANTFAPIKPIAPISFDSNTATNFSTITPISSTVRGITSDIKMSAPATNSFNPSTDFNFPSLPAMSLPTSPAANLNALALPASSLNLSVMPTISVRPVTVPVVSPPSILNKPRLADPNDILHR